MLWDQTGGFYMTAFDKQTLSKLLLELHAFLEAQRVHYQHAAWSFWCLLFCICNLWHSHSFEKLREVLYALVTKAISDRDITQRKMLLLRDSNVIPGDLNYALNRSTVSDASPNMINRIRQFITYIIVRCKDYVRSQKANSPLFPMRFSHGF